MQKTPWQQIRGMLLAAEATELEDTIKLAQRKLDMVHAMASMTFTFPDDCRPDPCERTIHFCAPLLSRMVACTEHFEEALTLAMIRQASLRLDNPSDVDEAATLIEGQMNLLGLKVGTPKDHKYKEWIIGTAPDLGLEQDSDAYKINARIFNLSGGSEDLKSFCAEGLATEGISGIIYAIKKHTGIELTETYLASLLRQWELLPPDKPICPFCDKPDCTGNCRTSTEPAKPTAKQPPVKKPVKKPAKKAAKKTKKATRR